MLKQSTLTEMRDAQTKLSFQSHKAMETTKSTIISELGDAIGGVSITTDCWTSSATQSYMTVTANFVTKTHKLKSYMLQTCEVSERNTVKNLASELQKFADE